VLAALKEGGFLKDMKVIALTNLGQKEEVAECRLAPATT